MKTKITAAAVMLAVGIAVTVAAANPFGSARTIPLPIQGDPVPGIDVGIEQSPGGIKKGPTTDKDGSATGTVNPGPVVLTFRRGRGVAAGRAGGSFLVYGSSTGGGKSASGTWSKLDEPFKLEMVVAGSGPQRVTVRVTETVACK